MRHDTRMDTNVYYCEEDSQKFRFFSFSALVFLSEAAANDEDRDYYKNPPEAVAVAANII